MIWILFPLVIATAVVIFQGQIDFWWNERNPVELARKANEGNKKIINASRLVYDSDFVGKIVPIAQYLGFDTDRESDLIMWDIDNYARNNAERFVELLDSPVIQRYSDVGRAIKMGIVRIVDST